MTRLAFEWFKSQNCSKVTKFSVFGYETWVVQSNEDMIGIIFGIETDQCIPLLMDQGVRSKIVVFFSPHP